MVTVTIWVGMSVCLNDAGFVHFVRQAHTLKNKDPRLTSSKTAGSCAESDSAGD